MLISNIFSRKVYPITVIGLVALEFIFLIFISIFFYVSLNHNTDYLDNTIIANNREIQQSFNSFLTRRIISAKQDLFLIGKHSDIFMGKLNMTFDSNSKFYKNFKSCLIEGSQTGNYFGDEYNKISDAENPIISFVNNYLKNYNDSEEMIKDFQRSNLSNYISFFAEDKKEEINKYE